jgi:hypothetical protein
MKLIAFTGKMGAGKTTAAQIMRENAFPVFTVKFAKPLYDLQSIIYEYLNMPEPVKDRKLLQFLGTDWGRSIDSQIWIKRWQHEVRHLMSEFPGGYIICDDLRFQNEAEAVRNMGGTIIAIEGESRGEFVSEGKRHSSETDMKGIVPNITIKNDGTITRLKDKVLKAVGGL